MLMPLLIALGLALVSTPLAALAGQALGLVDRPAGGDLKIHRAPVSVLGGFAVVISFLGATTISGRLTSWPLVVAGVAALTVGVLDDAWDLHPGIRVLLLTVSGGVLLATPLLELRSWVGVVVILLVLACANAVNITDGQDGLAGGLAALAAMGLAAVGADLDDRVTVALALALAGALLGFVVWNLIPGRIFLGNGGAYAVGLLLAYLSARAATTGGFQGLVAAGACMGVFVFELVFTLARRAVSRDVLSAGDRDHSYDLLSRSTGRRGSTAVFWVLGALCAGLGVLVVRVSLPLGAGAVALAAAAGGIWAMRLWGRRSAPV